MTVSTAALAAVPTTAAPTDLEVVLGTALALAFALSGFRAALLAHERQGTAEARPHDGRRLVGGALVAVVASGVAAAWIWGSLAYTRRMLTVPDARWSGEAFGGANLLGGALGMAVAGGIAYRCFGFAEAGGWRRIGRIPAAFYLAVALLMVPVVLSEFRVGVVRMTIAQKVSATRGHQTLVGADGRVVSVTRGTFDAVDLGDPFTCRLHVTPVVDQISPLGVCRPHDPNAPERPARTLEG